MLCGTDDRNAQRAVIVELKQWDRCNSPTRRMSFAVGSVGATERFLHPSVQVGHYRQYLEDTHTAFHEGPNPIVLSACSYLHNYKIEADDPIVASKFEEALKTDPLFDLDDAESLAEHLRNRLGAGSGRPVLIRCERSRYRSSRKLMDHVATAIEQQSPWVLLDEQVVVFEHIRDAAKRGLTGRKKHVVIVRGGPGTGKSVLAINLMAQLLRDGTNSHYATGSKAFTETLGRS